jgi:hypothetical protein
MPFDEAPNAVLPLFQNPRLVWLVMQIGQRTVLQRVISARDGFARADLATDGFSGAPCLQADGSKRKKAYVASG